MLLDILSRPSSPPKRPGTTGRKKGLPNPQELLHPTSALAHAELLQQKASAPSRQLCLGELVVPFASVSGQRGFEHHTFQEMWELYSQYLAQEDRPEQVSAEQRELTQKAHSSVRRWLHTPVTHITSVQMKWFRRFIKEKDHVSTRCDVSSWPNDEAELVAASQAVEDLLNSEEAARLGKTSSHSQGSCPTEGTKQPKQPDPTVRQKQPEPPYWARSTVQAEGCGTALSSGLKGVAGTESPSLFMLWTSDPGT
ncbi:uncharacterized protein LOC130211314 [Pseudoliparis swirei]|uniref:uncharacterized protein LOC130211314 n=1 Tax=Pseudoliparis swirei TaxID=2059687 RepID=UPI0024BE570A|nr:uncharacterized protein LOC130211314 [Pseudoliparis swirei]